MEPAYSRIKSKPRILCLTGSPDVPQQYIPVMNTIFSAQRAEVVIDALVLHPDNSSLLQQAAHLTQGLYFKPEHRSGVLQYLLQNLACDSHTRAALQVYQPQGVDFRASCFCHKNVIDIGYVCSVCLSIYCRQSGSCTTCGTCFVRRTKAQPGTPAG